VYIVTLYFCITSLPVYPSTVHGHCIVVLDTSNSSILHGTTLKVIRCIALASLIGQYAFIIGCQSSYVYAFIYDTTLKAYCTISVDFSNPIWSRTWGGQLEIIPGFSKRTFFSYTVLVCSSLLDVALSEPNLFNWMWSNISLPKTNCPGMATNVVCTVLRMANSAALRNNPQRSFGLSSLFSISNVLNAFAEYFLMYSYYNTV
jgi:hypothetical protein